MDGQEWIGLDLAFTLGLDLALDGIWIWTGWDGFGLEWIGPGWKYFPVYFSHGRKPASLADEVEQASVGVYE